MIHYDLICDKGHAFDGWFRNSAAYDEQAGRGLVTCTQCGTAKVEKQMMLRSNGRRTVPQIFIGENHVGGSDDIHELDRRGQLDPMLQTQ